MKLERSGDFTDKENNSYSNDVTIGLKSDGTIFVWNNVAENIFGYPAIEAVGQNISFLFSKQNFKKESEFLEKVKAGNTEHYEIPCKTKAGKQIFISFFALPHV